MKYPWLKDLEAEKAQSEGIEVKYITRSQRRLGTRLTPVMKRQKASTKLRMFRLKDSGIFLRMQLGRLWMMEFSYCSASSTRRDPGVYHAVDTAGVPEMCPEAQL